MKFFLITIFSFVSFSYAQIETRDIIKNNSKDYIYDGSINFLAEKALAYKDEEFYLNGKVKSLQKWGYSNFFTSITSRTPYKCCSEASEFNSSYEQLARKNFKVLDVIPTERTKEFPILYSEYFFKLLEKESNDILYYYYDGDFEHNFPFIVMKHYYYLKEKHINNTYIFSTTFLKDNLDIHGNKIIPKIGEKWTVNDLIIDNENNVLKFLLNNMFGIQTYVDYSVFEYTDINKPILSVKEFNYYKNKFGVINWNLIFEEGEVKIGFTEEMCRLAWGEPNKINKTSYGNQWVYDDNYLYFKNGKLTSFN